MRQPGSLLEAVLKAKWEISQCAGARSLSEYSLALPSRTVPLRAPASPAQPVRGEVSEGGRSPPPSYLGGVNGGRRVDGPVEALSQSDDLSDHRDDGGIQASSAPDDVAERPDPHLLRFRRSPADQ